MSRIRVWGLRLKSGLPYSGYFLPGENFRQFRHLLSLVKILSANFFSCINDYTVDVATALAKIKSGEIFMQYTSANFGEICLPRNISAIRYIITLRRLICHTYSYS